MKEVKTSKFRFGKYKIYQGDRIDGLTDIPCNGKCDDEHLDMMIMNGNTLRALNSALHEALHADGYPNELLHNKEGFSDTDRIARFLWRLGWRKTS